MKNYIYYIVLLVSCITFSCTLKKKTQQSDSTTTTTTTKAIKQEPEDKGKFSSSDPVVQMQEIHKPRPPRPDSRIAAIKQFSDSIFLYIEKTSCYGKCPTYSAKIYPDGNIIFDGRRYVNKVGMHKGQLNQEIIDELKTMIQDVNYFDFEDIYDSAVTDLPSTYTMVNMDGQKKIIKSRHNVPETLQNFEKHLNQLILSYSWLSN